MLFWLNLVAELNKPARTILREHWQCYGRDYFTRHDYEDLPAEQAEEVMAALRQQLPTLAGGNYHGHTVQSADDFRYTDPVDGSVSTGQGLRILFEDGARIVFRLSGTGTSGATLRVYHDSYQRAPGLLGQDPQKALASLIAAADELAGIRRQLGRQQPDVIT